MVDPNFKEIRTGITQDGRSVRLVYRHTLTSNSVTKEKNYCYSIATGNCILFNGAKDEMEARFFQMAITPLTSK